VPGTPPGAADDPDQEVLLAVDGVLDTRGADRLRAQLEDAFAPRRRLVLDLGDVEHVSSAALAVLVSGHRRLRDGGGVLLLRSPSPAVVRELRISGLHRVIAVDPPEHDHP
jgi:anti-sigma B factor antagonist